jgi:hypothetical protein
MSSNGTSDSEAKLQLGCLCFYQRFMIPRGIEEKKYLYWTEVTHSEKRRSLAKNGVRGGENACHP